MGAIKYHDAEVRAFCANGVTAKELADAIGCSVAGIKHYAKREGLTLLPGKRGPSSGFSDAARQRAEQMGSMYRQGLTLSAIGAKFGLTRERVRQLLRKIGVNADEGGQAKVTQAKAERKRKAREARCQARFGVDLETHAALRECGALRAYLQQQRTSANRGVAFALTLPEWWAIWQASGKFHLRGVGKGRYCMSRLNDQGGYELGNVHIALCEDNSREALTRNRPGNKEFPGVFLIYPGRSRSWVAKYGSKNIGFYESAREAHEARVAYMAANGLRPGGVVGRGRGWTLLKGCKSRPYQMVGPGGARSYHATAEEAEAAYREACRAYIERRTSVESA